MSVGSVRAWLTAETPRLGSADEDTSVRKLAGTLALLGLGLLAAVRIGLNLPVQLPVSGVYEPALLLATLAPAVGLLVLGTTGSNPVALVVSTFAGVFGVLSVIAEPAIVPATVATGVGLDGITSLGVIDRFQPESNVDTETALVGAVLAIGGLLSLGAGMGIDPVRLRPLGSAVVLLGLLASPVFVAWRRESLLVGLGAGVAVAAIGTLAPFVTGAVSLVVGGVVGVSLPLLALAIAGVVALLWSSVRAGRVESTLAAGILLVTGVPAALSGGLAYLVALSLLLGQTHD